MNSSASYHLEDRALIPLSIPDWRFRTTFLISLTYITIFLELYLKHQNILITRNRRDTVISSTYQTYPLLYSDLALSAADLQAASSKFITRLQLYFVGTYVVSPPEISIYWYVDVWPSLLHQLQLLQHHSCGK